jgi:hypothetical protein
MTQQKIINELLSLEAMGEQMKERAYRARVALESFHSPAPSGASKKGLSVQKKNKLLSNMKKNILKQQ